MKTTVVNRRNEPEDTYVGRGSQFGNPFIAHNVPSKYGGVVAVQDTATAIARYRTWLTTDEEIPGWTKPSFEAIWKLHGQRLGCFCKGDNPIPCHGDVLVELVEAMEEAGGPLHLAAGLEEYEAQQAALLATADRDLRDHEVKLMEEAHALLEAKVATIKTERGEHHCHAVGCEMPVPPEMLMCHQHWYMVPKRHRNAVWAAYREGQCDDMRPSAAWFIAAERAITAVAVRERKMSAVEAERRVAREIDRYGEQAKADAAKEAKDREEWAEKLRAMRPIPSDDDVGF
jgi:hypothetical protein